MGNHVPKESDTSFSLSFRIYIIIVIIIIINIDSQFISHLYWKCGNLRYLSRKFEISSINLFLKKKIIIIDYFVDRKCREKREKLWWLLRFLLGLKFDGREQKDWFFLISSIFWCLVGCGAVCFGQDWWLLETLLVYAAISSSSVFIFS